MRSRLPLPQLHWRRRRHRCRSRAGVLSLWQPRRAMYESISTCLDDEKVYSRRRISSDIPQVHGAELVEMFFCTDCTCVMYPREGRCLLIVCISAEVYESRVQVRALPSVRCGIAVASDSASFDHMTPSEPVTRLLWPGPLRFGPPYPSSPSNAVLCSSRNRGSWK